MTGNTSIGNRRADYLGGEIAIDGDELQVVQHRGVRQPAGRPAGTATVGQIAGPAVQADGTSRCGRSSGSGAATTCTPIVDVFNLFDTVNFANFAGSSLDANNAAFGTLTSAQPSRSFQFGVRFDF